MISSSLSCINPWHKLRPNDHNTLLVHPPVWFKAHVLPSTRMHISGIPANQLCILQSRKVQRQRGSRVKYLEMLCMHCHVCFFPTICTQICSHKQEMHLVPYLTGRNCRDFFVWTPQQISSSCLSAPSHLWQQFILGLKLLLFCLESLKDQPFARRCLVSLLLTEKPLTPFWYFENSFQTCNDYWFG